VDNYIKQLEKNLAQAMCIPGSRSFKENKQIKATGKHVRAKILFLIAKNIGPINFDIIQSATALELIHTSSLLHDDVMDYASTRRDNYTLNKLYHNKYAILVGDYFLCEALKLIDKLSSEHKGQISQMILKQIQIMVQGQFLEEELRYQSLPDFKSYLEIYDKKTVPLFQLAFLIPTLLFKTSIADHELLKEAALYAGRLFQLADDLADWFANPEIIGKPIFMDYANQIYNLPILFFLTEQSFTASELADFRQHSAEKLQSILNEHAIPAKLKELGLKWFNHFLTILDKLDLPFSNELEDFVKTFINSPITHCGTA